MILVCPLTILYPIQSERCQEKTNKQTNKPKTKGREKEGAWSRFHTSLGVPPLHRSSGFQLGHELPNYNFQDTSHVHWCTRDSKCKESPPSLNPGLLVLIGLREKLLWFQGQRSTCVFSAKKGSIRAIFSYHLH